VISQIEERYRYPLILLRELVSTNFTLRYQGSYLGYLWSLLRPLGLFAVLYAVFVKFLRVGDAVPHFPVYLLLGVVLWTYFSEVTNSAVGSIVGQGDLIRKINFPKWVVVVAGSMSAIINLGFNLAVVALFMVINDVPLSWRILWLPLILVELFVLALAFGFLLSALFVRLRDLGHIWEVVMQGAFYATPILYPLGIVPLSAAKLLMLNPVAQIVQDARWSLVTPETTTMTDVYGTGWARLITVGITLVLAAVSVWYFRSRSPMLAEEV
jgi:ABC-2 type transport system permease protein